MLDLYADTDECIEALKEKWGDSGAVLVKQNLVTGSMTYMVGTTSKIFQDRVLVMGEANNFESALAAVDNNKVRYVVHLREDGSRVREEWV